MSTFVRSWNFSPVAPLLARAVVMDDLNTIQSFGTNEQGLRETNYMINPAQTRIGYIQCDGITLLHLAAFYNSLDCFRYLVETINIKYNIKSAAGYHPLHFACLAGSLEIVDYIISEHEHEAAVDTPTEYQYLYLAVVSGQYEIVQAIFDSGCDPESPGNLRYSPMQKAIEIHAIDIIQLLLEKSPERYENSEDTNIIYAIRRREYDAIPLLLDAGENGAAYAANQNNDCALRFACQQRHEPTVREICGRYGPRINPPKHLHVKDSPVHWVCMCGSLTIAQLVLQCNIDVNAISANNHTGPFYFISTSEPYDEKLIVFKLLLQHGFDLNSKKAPKSLIQDFLDAFNQPIPLIQFALQNGANPYVPNVHPTHTGTVYEISQRHFKEEVRDVFKEFSFPESHFIDLENQARQQDSS